MAQSVGLPHAARCVIPMPSHLQFYGRTVLTIIGQILGLLQHIEMTEAQLQQISTFIGIEQCSQAALVTALEHRYGVQAAATPTPCKDGALLLSSLIRDLVTVGGVICGHQTHLEHVGRGLQ